MIFIQKIAHFILENQLPLADTRSHLLNDWITCGTWFNEMENQYVMLNKIFGHDRIIQSAGRKYLTKAAIGAAVLTAGLSTSYQANAQDDEAYKRNWPVMDFYSRPNIVQGESKSLLEYVGSGDLNNDGVLNQEDVNLIYSGTKNDMAKIQGYENIDSADGDILEKYISGESNLPGDWDNMNKLEGIDSETGYNKRYVEKIKWLQKRILPNQIHDFAVGGLCGNFSKNYFFNFTGIANFENYGGMDDNYDGINEGYNEYKNTVNNGHENIPSYLFLVTKENGEAHLWPGIFIGEKEAGKEDSPLKLDNYYIFDYGSNGERVLSNTWAIDGNKPITVYTLTYNEVTQKDELVNLIPFKLKDGVATVDTFHVDPNIMFQNPHEAKVNLNYKENVVIEADGTSPDFSENNIGKPSLETNLHEHRVLWSYLYPDKEAPTVDYTPIVTSTDSEFIPFDSKYPTYGELTRTYTAASTMGRWNPTNEPALADTTEFKIIVDDTIAPKLTLNQNSVEGKKGSDPEKLAKSVINEITDASMNYNYPLDTLVTGTQTPYFEDNDFYYYDTQISVKDVRGKISNKENVEVKIKKNGTGIEELVTNNKEIDIDIYPNPVTSNTTLKLTSKNYLKEGKIYISNSLGQIVDIIEVNNLMPTTEKEIRYSGFRSVKNGIYIVCFTANGNAVSETICK